MAQLAGEAAGLLEIAAGDADLLRRAALLHELGRVAVPGTVWERPRALTAAQWEQVRLHPYHTERILARSTVLQHLAHIAGMHHERQDGSGYHHGASGAELPAPARLLAAADSYQAMTQDRPHRPARTPEAAAHELEAATRAGRFDPECTRAVIQAAGQRPSRSRSSWSRGLSDREVEVLRLVARGLSNRQIADALVISPRTAEHHVQHVYTDRRVHPRHRGDVRHGARPAALTAAGRRPAVRRPSWSPTGTGTASAGSTTRAPGSAGSRSTSATPGWPWPCGTTPSPARRAGGRRRPGLAGSPGAVVGAVTIPYRSSCMLGGTSPDRAEDQTVRIPIPTRALVAWSLWLVAFGCCAAGLAVTLAVVRPLTIAVLAEGAARALAYPLGYATVGLVLTLRRPANPIGWLYAAAGLVWSLATPGDVWLGQLVAGHRPLPLAAQAAAVYGELNWALATVLGVTLPALLVPDGRLRSRRWRPVTAAGAAGAALVLVGDGLAPGRLEDLPIANPFGLAGTAGDVAAGLAGLGTLLWAATMVASLTCVVLRFRSSGGVERQQLRWVAAGAAVAVAGLLAGAAVPQDTALPGVLYSSVLCVPVAVAVAVLRYRLWDLDRLVSRTVTYAVVTALLAVPYVLVVPAAGRLVAGSGSLAVAAATLAAAAAFQPLRRRVQDLVDRRFNRRRYDAAVTVDGFARRLRDQVDLDALHGELLAVVDQTMQPAGASLWLRPQPPRTAAAETAAGRSPRAP